MKYSKTTIPRIGCPDDFVFFWGHTDCPHNDPHACLSQWHPSPFFLNGVFYNCAEQYMMAEKARLFADEQALQQIMASYNPLAIKKLGRTVRNFDATTWQAHCYDIVVKGNMAKFTQSPHKGEILLSTGNKIIAEASPYDTIWGIGLAADDPRALRPGEWPGSNLLGFALMEVRDILANRPQKHNLMRTKSGTTLEFTPSKIFSLRPHEVFVFGSNLAGQHGGGAARYAYEHFGAVWGVGVGLQGQSYAIPTMQGGVETIKPYVDQFIQFAKANPQLTFYVTRIGCGIAGFKDKEIAPLFAEVFDQPNVLLPLSFAGHLI